MLESQINNAVAEAQKQLEAIKSENDVPIALNDKHDFQDGWLYIMVKPTGTGIRSSDYADAMGAVEKKLWNAGFDEVLLVPVLPD